MTSRSTRTLGVRLSNAQAAEVEAYAARRGEFASSVIRRALLREIGEPVRCGR